MFWVGTGVCVYTDSCLDGPFSGWLRPALVLGGSLGGTPGTMFGRLATAPNGGGRVCNKGPAEGAVKW